MGGYGRKYGGSQAGSNILAQSNHFSTRQGIRTVNRQRLGNYMNKSSHLVNETNRSGSGIPVVRRVKMMWAGQGMAGDIAGGVAPVLNIFLASLTDAENPIAADGIEQGADVGAATLNDLHSPIGFELFKAMYKRYIVLGCKYVITLTNLGNSERLAGWITADNDVAEECTTFDEALARPSITTFVLAGFNPAVHVGNNPSVTLKGYLKMGDYVAIGQSPDTAHVRLTDNSDAAGHNTVNTVTQRINIQQMGQLKSERDIAINDDSVEIIVQYEFDVAFFEPQATDMAIV